jgi:hypothetical protein
LLVLPSGKLSARGSRFRAGFFMCNDRKQPLPRYSSDHPGQGSERKVLHLHCCFPYCPGCSDMETVHMNCLDCPVRFRGRCLKTTQILVYRIRQKRTKRTCNEHQPGGGIGSHCVECNQPGNVRLNHLGCDCCGRISSHRQLVRKIGSLSTHPVAVLSAWFVCSALSCFFVWMQEGLEILRIQRKENDTMFRKILVVLVMGILLVGAAASGTSLPMMLFMGSLLLIALAHTSARNEQQE